MRQLFALAVGAVALAAFNPAPARAQATTTFVSGDGLDTNPCTVAAPCRSFQRAHDQTAAGGQITMLDPAGYGAVTITKAISIVNDGGGEAGITSGFDAIRINAGTSDVVNLRGLTLDGIGAGVNGIQFTSGGTLNIQNCVIRGFTGGGAGVLFAPSASAAITITDTIVSSNSNGVFIAPSGGTTTVSLERVAAIGNLQRGISGAGGGSGTMQGTIVDSAAIGNLEEGFFLGPGAEVATIALVNSQAIGNDVGVNAGTGTVMSRVTLAGNKTHGFISSNFETFGDNYIIDTTNVGTLTSIAEQ